MQRDRVERQGSLSLAVLRLGGLAVLTLTLGGCGPELSKSDLGNVVFEVPKVAEADRPYVMPKLGSADEKKAEKSSDTPPRSGGK